MAGVLGELRSSLEGALAALGRYALFAGRLIAETPRALLRFRLVVEQVHNAGALSLVIIMLSGLFVGMVLGLQGFDLLERFGSEESLGTGHGRSETSYARHVAFERATLQPAETIAIRYDSHRNLVAMGVIRETPRHPRPFPGFVPDA